ncbi:MAG: tyrosine-type recombinase/integrase, partial [Gammaproteobacteria bacterium]|nr:tyrosine-type recombinase/integrase [Gammaproteobacteria bacterium]
SMIAAYLNRQTTDEVYNKHRSMLGVIYKHAISNGSHQGDNLPLKILPRDGQATQRVRLTLDAYKAIYANATPHLQSAMELALNCLQRREDLRQWQFADKRPDSYIYKIISKTKARGIEAYIRIPASLPLIHSERGCKTLDQLISTCRDNTASPYLVHMQPARRQKSKEKDHWTQLSGKQISDSFAQARDATGLYNHITVKEHRPGIHECIALGEHLMEKAGWGENWIQLLRGHQKIETTRIYLEDHEWTTIPLPK